jgi:hypothetical protein
VESPPVQNALATLRMLLASAGDVVEQLLGHPLFPRLVQVFERMPAEDREVIVAVLEREVAARLGEQESKPFGADRSARPNPRARLYLHVYESPDAQPDPLRADLILATMRAARLITSVGGRLPAESSDAVLAAFRELTPEQHDALVAFHNEVLELLARSRDEPR